MYPIFKYLVLPFAIAHIIFDAGRQNTYIPLAISICCFYCYVFVTLKRLGYFKNLFKKPASPKNQAQQQQKQNEPAMVPAE